MNRECAIPMCGSEEEDEGALVPCCANGHFLHKSCAGANGDMPCPMCRSWSVRSMLHSATLPLDVVCQSPYSQFGAAVAFYVGILEHEKATATNFPRV